MVENTFSKRQIILIDALDECDHDGKNDLLSCIRDHFLELPSWIGFFMTTRPEVNIITALSKFHPEPLVADSEKNMKDICLFLRNSLVRCLLEEELDEGVELLGKKSKGCIHLCPVRCGEVEPAGHGIIGGFTQFPGRHHWFLRYTI